MTASPTPPDTSPAQDTPQESELPETAPEVGEPAPAPPPPEAPQRRSAGTVFDAQRRRLVAWFQALPPANTAVTLLLYAVLIFVLQYVIREAWAYPPFQPDSWTYVELSKSVLTDPGHINTFRSYVSTDPYTSSFPLLWPFAIALIDVFTGSGPRAGMLGAAAAIVVAAIMLDRAGHRFFGWRGVGPASMLLLFVFSGFEQEAVAGGSMPMYVALLATLIAVASNPWPLSNRKMALLGVVSGLMVLTRFDALSVVMLVPLALLVVRATKRRGLLYSYGGMAVALVPWVLYSLVRFRKPFITDNASVATSVRPMFVLDYPVPGRPTLSTDPSGWFARIRDNFGHFVPHQWGTAAEAFVFRPLVALFVIVLAWSVVARVLDRRDESEPASSFAAVLRAQLKQVVDSRAVRLFAVLAIVAVVALAVAQSTTGYFQDRYSTTLLLVLYLLLIACVLAVRPTGRVFPVVAVAVVLLVGLIPVFQARKSITLVPYVFLVGPNPRPEVIELAACVGSNDRILFMDIKDAVGFSFGALSNGKGLIGPSNWGALTPQVRSQILKDYGVTMVALSRNTPVKQKEATVARIEKSLGTPTTLESHCLPGLYRLVPAPN